MTPDVAPELIGERFDPFVADIDLAMVPTLKMGDAVTGQPVEQHAPKLRDAIEGEPGIASAAVTAPGLDLPYRS